MESVPRRVTPMMLLPAPLPPDDEAYAYEVKWDGFRALVRVDAGKVSITSRNLRDLSRYYPHGEALATALRGRSVLLDAELVALSPEGHPDFEALARRWRQDAVAAPVALVFFDLLHLDGSDLMRRPYLERRALLDSLPLRMGPHWQTPGYQVGGGAELLAASRRMGLEGLVAKRIDSAYRPGHRSRDWLKIKNWRSQAFVVGGWTEHRDGAGGFLGSLLLGHYDDERRLLYAGRVEMGLGGWVASMLAELFPALRRASSPFALAPRSPTVRWIEPRLVCEVRFNSWTSGGVLRTAMLEGFVVDVDPCSVKREE
jgi:bifunctional non-homologous end joining protein LigD